MPDLSLIDEKPWREAEWRAAVLRPLAAQVHCPSHLVRAAAGNLRLTERQTWRLLRRLRQGEGAVTALVSAGPNGGRGGTRLPGPGERLLAELITERFLTTQRLSPAAFIREVRGRCRQQGVRPPSSNTIRRRLAGLGAGQRQSRGDALADPSPVLGTVRTANFPLDLVQIDHTKADIILVDPIDRLPIGRPWITVAIDVASRMIAGFHISLDAPGATSVGLCLVHVAMDKAAWLSAVGVEAQWPLAGKPRTIGVDNAAEFHSQAFERGCAQHGIIIDWRPPGLPHFGGIVERVIGTLMKLVHALPGTTFSSSKERGDYPSEKLACLTLGDIERWLTVAIAKYYHLNPHEGLSGEPPLDRAERGLLLAASNGRSPAQPGNSRSYLIDFLPVIRRTLQRDGIKVDHVTYFAQALVPWIAERKQGQMLVIRRDPRDLSRIFVLDENGDAYVEVPNRDLAHPSISLWEHRMARRQLRRNNRAVSEAAIFDAIGEMRIIEQTAVTLTRSARRDRTRRAGQQAMPVTSPPVSTSSGIGTAAEMVDDIRPFDIIEIW